MADEPECPFCPGREAATPPEVLALGSPGRKPDTAGWRVRVVPNLFPAFSGGDGRQEVVVQSPRHVLSLADLTEPELADVAAAWAARAAAARAEGFGYLHAFVNEGRAAGASLPHTHSQLLWLPEPPPAVARELRGGGCVLCDLLARERVEAARVVCERDGLVLLCPWASRSPYELLCAPAVCGASPFDDPGALAGALRLAADGIRWVRTVAGGDVPLNAWLHTGALTGGRGHWHVEVVPRLTVAAGLELGGELYVNPLPPEEAARALRGDPER